MMRSQPAILLFVPMCAGDPSPSAHPLFGSAEFRVHGTVAWIDRLKVFP
jgi:hypothetical protein